MGERASIGVGQGVALYVCAILGAGVLVFPGQAASMAGPASLLAWGFSALIGLPLAFVFAALATTFPDAGGVGTYAAKAFGRTAGGVAGWWYFVAGSVGQAIVPLTAGYYVTSAMHASQRWAPAVAAAVLAIATGANLAGLRVGARVQLALAGGVAVILLAVIGVAVPQLHAHALTPFAPHGAPGIGRAVIVLFFAFAGWEAIAHLSAEFRDVDRTMPRATLLTVLVVTTLYLGIAFVVVGTGSYGDAERDRTSLGLIVQHGLGLSAMAVMAVAAVVICLGTTNAFIASVSRLGYALGREGWAPRPLTRQSRDGTPTVGVLAVSGIGAAGLGAAAVFGWGTDDILVVPSVLVLATYLLGMAAGLRLLTGRRRMLSAVAATLLLVTVPFAGWRLLIPLTIAAVIIAARVARRPRCQRALDA